MISQGSPLADAISRALDRRVAARTRLVRRLGVFTDDNFYTGFTEDISEGGLFACTHELLAVGTSVQLSLELPGGHNVEATGRVRWLREPYDPLAVAPGMGIEFDDISPTDRAAIREFMQSREPMFHQQ